MAEFGVVRVWCGELWAVGWLGGDVFVLVTAVGARKGCAVMRAARAGTTAVCLTLIHCRSSFVAGPMHAAT